MIRAALFGGAIVLLTATSGDRAGNDRAALDKALVGRVAGAAVTCLPSTWSVTPKSVGNRTLLYHDGRRIWRNDLPDACPGLNDDAIIVSELHGTQQCRGDLFYTIDRAASSIPGPRCRLGSFVPYEKVAR